MKNTKKIKAWAIVLEVDNSIPDFSIMGQMFNIYQVHSVASSAHNFVRKIGKAWKVVPCEIILSK